MKSMQKGFTLIELMIVVAIIAILAAIAIPQYQAYVIRSQVTRVMNEAAGQQVTVTDCLNNGETLGTGSCVNTATSSDLTTTLPVITLGAAGAPSTVVATFGKHANVNISGTDLTWTLNASGAWSCATTAPAKYAPASCPGK